MKIFNWMFKSDAKDQSLEVKSDNSHVWDLALDNSIATGFSSAITAVLLWISRNAAEADLVFEVMERGDYVSAQLPNQLSYTMPNSNFTHKQRLAATMSDLSLYGNSLWIKLRNGRGTLQGFQYVPWDNVTVNKSSDNTAIQSYMVNNSLLGVKDVIHFRNGSQPGNHLLGIDIWSALSRHNDADLAGSIYIDSVINSPAPKQILTVRPDKDGRPLDITKEAVERITRRITSSSRLSKAGIFPVLDVPLDAIPNGYAPKDMMISELVEYGEARICALFGVPTQIIGLTAGQNPTYSNYQQAQRVATVNCLVPMWAIVADTLTSQAPEMWVGNGRLRFDYVDTAAMIEDQERQVEMVTKKYTSGVIDRFTALAELGYDPSESEKGIYYSVKAPSVVN